MREYLHVTLTSDNLPLLKDYFEQYKAVGYQLVDISLVKGMFNYHLIQTNIKLNADLCEVNNRGTIVGVYHFVDDVLYHDGVAVDNRYGYIIVPSR